MRLAAPLGLALLMLENTAAGAPPQYQGQIRLGWPDSSTVELSIPSQSKLLEISTPGFHIDTQRTEANGRRGYVQATNKDSGVILSAFLEHVDPGAKGSDCRTYLENWTKANLWLHPIDVKSSQLGDMQILEYLVPEFQGKPVQQKNVFACFREGAFFADVHVSKTGFKPEEEDVLLAVIKSAHFKDAAGVGSPQVIYPAPSPASGPGPEATSAHYFGVGSRYFLERQLPQAIVQYRKALELEKKERKLPRDEWRVLVDNLGMSYGMTGDLKHAEEVYRYGISQDPTYPNFYYSMACVYGERNDLENAMKYLKTAFAYKDNVIAGETMPDPRRDDSFRYFMKNPRFLSLVDSLTAPSK